MSRENIITWQKVRGYLTSCSTIWQRTRDEVNQIFGITKPLSTTSSTSTMTEWESEKIIAGIAEFNYEEFQSNKQVVLSYANHMQIILHEWKIINKQFIRFYCQKIKQKKIKYVLNKQIEINSNKARDYRFLNSQNNANILFDRPIIVTRELVHATPDFLYWNALSESWTIVTLITRRKFQLLDLRQVEFNYFTLKEVLKKSQATSPKINVEVYMLSVGDEAGKVEFVAVNHYMAAKKSSRSSEQLTNSWNKKITTSGCTQKTSRIDYWMTDGGQAHSNYQAIIIKIQNADYFPDTHLIYKKNVCKGPTKECSFFKICRSRYLQADTPLLAYSQNVLTTDVKKQLSSKKKQFSTCNQEFLFKPHYRFLVKQKKEVCTNSIKLAEFLDSIIDTKTTKLVWFDFETLTSPIPFTNKQLKRSQTPFQVSIIVTKVCGEILEVKNLLIIPGQANACFFGKIVDALYYKNAKYVVYNKSVERNILIAIGEQFFSSHVIYREKIAEITSPSKLIDLMQPFNSIMKNEPLIKIKSLKGNYSLKKVLEFLQIAYPKVITQAGVLDYNDMNIGDGFTATTFAKLAHYKLISTKEWCQKKQELIKYCENDVRAMIAIYFFLRGLSTKK